MSIFGKAGFQASSLRTKPARPIDPETVYRLAREGKSRRDMAPHFGLSYRRFTARIANSDSLSKAFRKGESEYGSK